VEYGPRAFLADSGRGKFFKQKNMLKAREEMGREKTY
jgi:hypothetical protein